MKDIYTIKVGVNTKNRYECWVGRKTTPLCVQQTKGTCPSTLEKKTHYCLKAQKARRSWQEKCGMDWTVWEWLCIVL
jgi:hypothetical protein